MRFDKFTIKSQELIQSAHALAGRYHNQQIEPEHLLAAMLDEKTGVAYSLLRKLGASPDGVAREIAMAVKCRGVYLPADTGRAGYGICRG